MARLVPSFLDDHTPPGERAVFNMLAAGPDDWLAFHSLDLAPWNRSLRTEIDFVLVVPDTGIACIEVKSQDNIEFDGERWSPPTIKRSPFKQAADARFAFHRRLSEVAPQYRHLPIVHCCIFPNAAFTLPRTLLSVLAYELIDGREFSAFRGGADLCNALRARMRQSIEADPQLRSLTTPLSKTQVEALIPICMPVSRRRVNAREEIDRRDGALARLLRDQQKPIRQLAVANDRVVIAGPAGTGKTLMAMELARDVALSGKRVALLCFNQLVGDWMHSQLSKEEFPNLVVGRAVRVMAEMTEVRIPANPGAEFWDVELPRALEDKVTEPDFKAAAQFDYLILDEAQDLLAKPTLWHCLMQFLVGGLASGRYALFGDFENQVLSDRGLMEHALSELGRLARPANWNLTENCRNYRIVGETALRLAGFRQDLYTAYLRSGGGLHNYDMALYDDDGAQLAQLRLWLGDLRRQGYRPSEISLLSFRADAQSCAAALQRAGYRLRSARDKQDETSVPYTTVHSFKGMENKAVILTDVVLTGHDFQRDLLYTGVTRATEAVRLLCHSESRHILSQWLMTH